MRFFLFVLALFTAYPTLAGESAPLTIAQVIKNDKWTVAEGTHNGKPLIIRYRGELSKMPDLRAYPRFVRIVWSYKANEFGLPSSSTSDKMGVFEDRLLVAVEPSHTAILVAVLTNAGEREWLFYTANVAEFGERLTAMPQEKDRYPIDLSTENYPEWSTFYNNVLPRIAE